MTLSTAPRLAEDLDRTMLSTLAEDQASKKTTSISGGEDEKHKIAPTDLETNMSDDDEYPSGIKMFFIVIGLVMSIFLLSLDMTIVATAIPKITDEFRGLDKVGWYGAAFFLTLGAMQSTWGKIYKFFPLKASFLLSILIFEVGSVICGAAPNSVSLIIGRAIAGIGAAGLGAGAYTIVAFAAPPKKRPAFTGILGASYGLASVIGPLLGGAFTGNVSWRWCFYINLPIGGLSAAVLFIFFQTPKKAVPMKAPLLEKLLQMDPLGIVLLMGASIAYILVTQYGGVTHAWNSALVIGLLVGFVVMILTWYFQGERSMISPRLFRERTNWVMSAFIFTLAGGYYTAIYYIPIYFQSVYGNSPTVSGVHNLPFIIAVTIATVSSGIFITVTGRYQPILIGGGVVSTIGSGLLYMLDDNSSTGRWVGYQVVAGLGWGSCFQIPMIAVQGSASPADLASTTAMVLFFQCIGGAYLVSGSQAAFINQMVNQVLRTAPQVNLGTLVLTGATEIRHAFPAQQWPLVIAGYMTGLKVVFAICIAATGTATVIGCFTPWSKLVQETSATDKS